MADTSTAKKEEEITTAPDYSDVNGGRRGTLASINLNKNLDAKYVPTAALKISATKAYRNLQSLQPARRHSL